MYNGPSRKLYSHLTSLQSQALTSRLNFVGHLDQYLKDELNSPTPLHSNPSDHAIQLVNTEFYDATLGGPSAQEHLDTLARLWRSKTEGLSRLNQQQTSDNSAASTVSEGFRSTTHKTGVLIERNFTNYRRNLLAFGIRREF